MSNHPIFIVGAPRSGTTLLAAMLAGHSRIACGPETQFFSKLNKHALRDAVQDPYWPNKAVESLGSLKLAGQRVHELFGLSREKLLKFLCEREPSVRALLEALTECYAQKMNKPRWAEKTPDHLLHLATIRKVFPNASIVHIVRDPRDAALSMRKLPLKSESILANCYHWNEWFQLSHNFFIHDKNSLTIRYEDLIADTRKVLSFVCEHIGEEFEAEMLDNVASAKNLISLKEPWKLQVTQPLDPSRSYIWKRELPPHLFSTASHICYPGLKAFDYQVTHKPKGTVLVYQLNRTFIEKNEDLIISAADCHIRIASSTTERFAEINNRLRGRELIFCTLSKKSTTIPTRFVNAFRFLVLLIRCQVRSILNKYLVGIIKKR